MATRRRSTLREQILAAMRATGLTDYEISRRSGVERATLSRFVRTGGTRGTGGLTLASLEKLADVLQIEIVVRKDKKR